MLIIFITYFSYIFFHIFLSPPFFRNTQGDKRDKGDNAPVYAGLSGGQVLKSGGQRGQSHW